VTQTRRLAVRRSPARASASRRPTGNAAYAPSGNTSSRQSGALGAYAYPNAPPWGKVALWWRLSSWPARAWPRRGADPAGTSCPGPSFGQTLAVGSFRHARSAVTEAGLPLTRAVTGYEYRPVPADVAHQLEVAEGSEILHVQSVRHAGSTRWT
jgi:hypothetical protein